MKIIYKTGDLMKAEESVIVHGCNAKGVMGSGVAALVRKQYPKAYDDYRAAFDDKGLALGEIIVVDCGGHTVVNAITQRNFGRDAGLGRVYVSYDAVRGAMSKINAWAKANGITAVAMPLIGAGLAGGSWAKIEAIIEQECSDVQPVVYLVDGVKPKT